MMRAFITLLLLGIFFLSGMVFGIDRTQDNHTAQSAKTLRQVTVQEPVDEQPDHTAVDTSEMVSLDEPEHFTQKAASFLETAIKGFCEMVVMAFYQIAQTFF